MSVRLSQVANVSSLPEAKKKNSVVISRRSNKRMQRSRASEFLIIASLLHARPADARRWAPHVP